MAALLEVVLDRAEVAQERRAYPTASSPSGGLCTAMRERHRKPEFRRRVLDRMFEPLLHHQGRRCGNGPGACPLVHGIVADLGGAIDVSHGPSAAARTFTILVTDCPAKVAASFGGARYRIAAAAMAKTVMIVDDEEAAGCARRRNLGRARI